MASIVQTQPFSFPQKKPILKPQALTQHLKKWYMSREMGCTKEQMPRDKQPTHPIKKDGFEIASCEGELVSVRFCIEVTADNGRCSNTSREQMVTTRSALKSP